MGEPIMLRPAGQVCIMANCQCLVTALAASRVLEKEGAQVGVVNVHTVKPLGKENIRAAAGEAKNIVTLEEHNILGGLGSAIAEVLSDEEGYRIVRVGVPDRFAPLGSRQELYREYGMDCEGFTEKIRALVR